MALHESLGKVLRPFELGRFGLGPNKMNVLQVRVFGKKVAEPKNKGFLGADQYNVNILSDAEVNNGVAIALIQVNAGSQCCHAGIAGSDKKIGEQRTLTNAPGKGRLPTP